MCGHSGVMILPDGRHELSPCRFRLEKKLKNVTVEILRCEICGDYSIGWIEQEDTEEIDEVN